ncbi:syntaxin-18 [Phymastichus coffea]|uniref:syntaxin-18 n=1 Tax=Phymastichus coffea TaxID=108790 RepID=UPI00273B2FA6|nr:syntaxin-18 [Phymastichus coffea]
MDISLNFKEAIQSILQHKNIGNSDKSNILNRIRKKHSFVTLVKLTCNQINEFYNIIQESRKAYQSLSKLLINKSYISYIDNNETDILARTFEDECLQLLEELKEWISHLDIPQQNQEHNKTVISIIEEYLKSISKIYSKQKILKTKQTIAIRQVFKLKSWKKQMNEANIQHFKYDAYSKNTADNIKVNSFEIQEINGDTRQTIDLNHEQLEPNDIQLFESENEQLYNELNTLTEEIKEIENKVVSISELQNVFSEKVLDQEKNLEYILTTVAGSTENVKEANEQIRNAIQRNAGFRVWILFFLIVLSFSLIFLDWYKP